MIPPARIRLRAPRPLAALALAAALLGTGCSRNTPGFVLIPTGVRPAPAIPTGGIWGFVRFDAAHYAGLDQAPFPPTYLSLFNDAGATVDSLWLGGANARFEFDRLPPGHYGLNIRSHAYKPGSFGWFTVSDHVQDFGDLGLTANTDSLASSIFIIGTMPGFSTDELGTYSTLMDDNDPGVWTYPSSWGSTALPAGTYRFKFVTDQSSTPGHLIGWGGDSTVVLTVPVTQAPVRFGTSAATDLKLTIRAAGTYLITFDERRLTFSITPAPAPLRSSRAVSRRIR